MWRFDIGGGRNVSQKWICWTGQAMLFRCCGTVIFGWFLVLWGYQSAFQWCLGVRLPGFEAKTTILQATQTSFCLFHVLGCENLTETVFLAATLCFYSGFKCDVLTSGVGEMCRKNGFVEPVRPCCFAAAEPSFLAGSWCCRGINRLFNGVWAWGCHDLRPKPRFCRPPKPNSAFFTC